MTQEKPANLMIGSQIIIKEKEPILIRFVCGDQAVMLNPATLIRMCDQLADMAHVAMFLNKYRMMLTVRGEPQVEEHLKDLLDYMGSLRDDATATSETARSTRFDNISKISMPKT